MSRDPSYHYTPGDADISWVMQSDQISERELVDILVERYSNRLKRLAHRVTGIPVQAHEMQALVVDTLTWAVINRHRYWADHSLFQWLARRMIRRWKVRRKPAAGAGVGELEPVEPEELAERVKGSLASSMKRQKTIRFVLQVSSGSLIVLFILGLFLTSQFFRVPAPRVVVWTPTHSRGLPGYETRPGYFTYKYYFQPGDTIDSVARKAGVPASAIKLGDSSIEEYTTDILSPGWQLTIPSSEDFRNSLSAAPPPAVQDLPLLTKDSSLEEIYARMEMDDTWSTVKVHYYLYDYYYLPGYAGPVGEMGELYLLARKPDQHVVIASIYGNQLMYLFRTNGINYNIDTQTGEIDGSFGDDDFLRSLTTGLLYEEISTISEKVVGEDWLSGRPVVIVEREISNGIIIRLLVDAETGIVLQTYTLEGSLSGYWVSLVVASIEYNQDIPTSWFDPGQVDGTLGEDDIDRKLGFPPLGPEKPEWLEYVHLEPNLEEPQRGFQIHTAPLTLQWPGDWDAYLNRDMGNETRGETPIYPVEVFASDYLLGTIEVEIGILTSCQRSPDGRRVVMGGSTDWNEYGFDYSSMYLFSLYNLNRPEVIRDIRDMSMYSFSPNSEKVVWSGCSAEMDCGFHVYDFLYGMWQTSAPRSQDEYVYRIGWSQDSSQIAYAAQSYEEDMNPGCRIFTIDLAAGESVLVEEAVNCSKADEALRSLGYYVGKDPQVEGCMYP